MMLIVSGINWRIDLSDVSKARDLLKIELADAKNERVRLTQEQKKANESRKEEVK